MSRTADDPLTLLVLELFQLHGTLMRFGDAFVQRHELSSASWQVLGAIARSDGGRTVPQIARRMGQARQSVQRQTNGLAARGLIESTPNPEHRRSPLLTLTREGRRVHDEIDAEWRAKVEVWRRRLRPPEVETTRDVVGQLREMIMGA